MQDSISRILLNIEAIELPVTLATAAAAPDLPALPNYKTGVPQAVVIGSQIAEFAANVPVELRADVANCFLLAQLAADKWIETHPHTGEKTWYNSYVATLRKCGWVVEGDESELKSVDGAGAQVHEQVIGVLSLALGPAVSAVSMVLGVLKGLQAMSKDQPFFTIFDQASNREEAEVFQISYVGVGSVAKEPSIRLAAFRLEATASVTQILFFKFQSAHVRLRSFSSTLSMDAAIFAEVRKAVFDKVMARAIGNITDIEI